jgi:hypothetical protein
MQGGPLHPVPGIRICALLKKKLSIFETSISRCYMQWSLTTFIQSISICTALKKESSNVEISCFKRGM